jgi:hypothetical protein
MRWYFVEKDVDASSMACLASGSERQLAAMLL